MPLDSIHQTLPARVSRTDPARTLAAKLAPKPEADRLISLYAFNYEIARVAESVSDPTLGEIRLQWWREAIEEIEAGKPVRAHDVAQSLEAAIRPIRQSLPFHLLYALVDARERDLDATAFDSEAAITSYTEATAGHLTLAAANFLSQSTLSDAVQTGLIQAGSAWGLAGLAREAAIARQFNAQPRLPITLEAELLAAAARSAHQKARDHLRAAPANLLPAYAYAALVPSLTREFTLEGASPLGMRWGILKAALVGRI